MPIDERFGEVGRVRFGRQLSAVSKIEELSADDDATLLLDALEKLPARFGADRPAGESFFPTATPPKLPASKRPPKATANGKCPCTYIR